MTKELSAKRRVVEARKWLAENPINSIGNHHWCRPDKDTHEDGTRLVETLYEMGATKVDVEVYGADDWAQTLIITMPGSDHDKFSTYVAGGLYADDVYEKDGILTVEWGD